MVDGAKKLEEDELKAFMRKAMLLKVDVKVEKVKQSEPSVVLTGTQICEVGRRKVGDQP